MIVLNQTFIMALTGREKQILAYIGEGFSSKEIADMLDISKNTVDNHRRNMIRKRNARNTAELAVRYQRTA